MANVRYKVAPVIYPAMAVASVAIFIADLYTPLGLAVWIGYLVPIALTLFLWRPFAPVVAAALSTLLMAIGFVYSPPGVDYVAAALNRVFGFVTVWVVAAIGYGFIRAKLTMRREEWLKSGHAGLNEKLAGDQQLEALGQNALHFLADYLGAQAGAIFFEQGGTFRRFATYAVPDASSVPERFAPGEGLLGQAARDGRAFVVDHVPEGYLTIGSALGRSRPRRLIISPAMVDGRVNAVLEFGFFQAVDEAAPELFKRVAESIGVAVRSAEFRTRLEELLRETQEQARQLQQQSEELRVTNEELEEQSRALRESQSRLEQQQSELEQTNTQLEEQTQLLEAQKDDVSRANRALEAQTRELEQASRYKSDFLANMSHELRTPLNSSLILATLLADNRDGNLNAEQVKYAETIVGAGQDLLALINDVLDLSKVEAGRLDVKPAPVRIADMLSNLRTTFAPLAAQKQLELHIQVAPGTPDTLHTDAQRAEQVLKNLVSNAIKFTERGHVTIDVSRPVAGRVAFAVRDTGIGVPADQQRTIFEPFRQADGTTHRQYGGTGLGLSISLELVRLLGGNLDLASEPGRGSTFTVTLPEVYDPDLAHVRLPMEALRRPPDAKVPPPRPAEPEIAPSPSQIVDDRERLNGNHRLILIVEDDEAFARILYDLAHELDFQALIATTSQEALAISAQYAPNAILLDVGLPDSTGLSVLDRLKADGRTRHIPVHVVSGSDYAQTAFSLGAVGYMLKPVKREQLVEAFQKLEMRLTQKMRRVLIVEDNAMQLESLRHLLGTRNVETVGARSAAECLEHLRVATFDCMVLDLTLPDASGFSLLDQLSKEDRYSFPPVIVYTGRDLGPEEEQLLRKYSKSIIIKGAKSPERLLDEVALFLHQVVADLPPEQQKLLKKARSRDAAIEGRRILVVEDDIRNVFALTSILEARGAKVLVARNGREALDTLERCQPDPDAAVDLVLMDIMMPEMDGLTATREIRKRPGWSKLPIITLTAKAMKDDQQQALQAGANDYLAKPLDLEKLLSLVRVWMPR